MTKIFKTQNSELSIPAGKETRYTAYDPFAWVYNRHWEAATLKFCPIIAIMLLRELPAGSAILDLCCGTGQVAGWLTTRGYRVTGLDGSEAMLSFARENAPEASFLLADARAFSLPPSVQAVVSTFDSLNHILDIGELTQAFRNAHSALFPGGVLLCDLNIRHGYIERWNGNFNIVESDHVCAWSTRYDDDTRLASWEMTIFRLFDTWERTDVRLTQRASEEEEIRQTLAEAGFADIRVYDNNRCPDGLRTLPQGRAFFLARKKE